MTGKLDPVRVALWWNTLHWKGGKRLTTTNLPEFKTCERIGHTIEWRWVNATTLIFRCIPQTYPLASRAAEQFLVLCDTVVSNFPSLLNRPHAPGRLLLETLSGSDRSLTSTG